MTYVRSQLRHSTSLASEGRTKPVVSADYIVGLTDGEGCFYVLVRPPFSRQGGGMVQLSFLIKVQEQDKAMLEKVKNSLRCGSVYYQHETRANHAQCYRYTVNSHRDIIGIIIPFFQQHPLQGYSKQKNFDIFCQIAQLVQNGVHHTRAGIEQIRALKAQMNHRARVVREIRSLRGDVKQRSLSRSARQAKRVGGTRTSP
ncbi:LAGLIDADG family homing endonuclease [Candidatus Falkowbacteria bacterium]|nr:LAGLIDADG family homing endonuclease [Candidatus Falkowbacteria bacterium]